MSPWYTRFPLTMEYVIGRPRQMPVRIAGVEEVWASAKNGKSSKTASEQATGLDTGPPGNQRVWEHDWAERGDVESFAGDRPGVKMQKVASPAIARSPPASSSLPDPAHVGCG